MADSLVRGWAARLVGRLEPRPMPFSQAPQLDMPARRLVASPERILGEFALAAGERVLEIGPGVGYYSVPASGRLGPGGRLVCLDLQGEMLAEVGRRLRAAALGGELLRGNAGALPLGPGRFDRVVLIGVLGEFPDRPRALAEIRRVLRPDGRLSVSEQMPDPDFVFKPTLRRELAAAGFVEERTRGHLWYTSTWRRTT